MDRHLLELLSSTPLFRGLAADEAARRVRDLRGTVRRYGKGDLVFREGERVRALGLLLEGLLHIVRVDWDGNRDIVTGIGPGEIFAESYACLEDTPLGVGVEAAGPSSVLLLESRRLLASDLAPRLVALLARKNVVLSEKLSCVMRRRTRDKLLAFLSAQARKAGAKSFEIPYDRQGLADYLAVERSAMSAALGRLRDEGRVAFRKNRFRLL